MNGSFFVQLKILYLQDLLNRANTGWFFAHVAGSPQDDDQLVINRALKNSPKLGQTDTNKSS